MEARECDSSSSDVPAGDTKLDAASLVSVETLAFESKQDVRPLDTVRVMHSGVTVDSAGLRRNEKETAADTVAACCSDNIAEGYNDDIQGGGIVPDNIAVVLNKKDAFEVDHCDVDSNNFSEIQAAASKQNGAMTTSARAEGFDDATTADVSRAFSTEQGIRTSSPKVPRIEEEATISFLGDNTGHVTGTVSTTQVNQEVASTAVMAPNQVESFEAPATEKLQGGKFMDATFHHLEENQVAEHAYDMDFDIDAHDMPLEDSFFDGTGIFPALHADKAEVWHAGVTNVIMEESSAEPHSNQHPQDVDVKSLPEETNNEPVTMHKAKESIPSNEEWHPNTQQQSSCKTGFVDAPHGMDEASEPSNRQVQCHEALAGYHYYETGGETISSDVVQEKKLVSNYSKDNDAEEFPVQYDTDDIFASLASANVETAQDAGSCEAKRSEEEVSTAIAVKEVEFEPTSINVTQEDAAVHLHKINEDMLGDPCKVVLSNSNSALRDAELPLKSRDLLEDSRWDNSIVQEEIVTDLEGQDKGTSQGNGSSDFEEKDEYGDIKSSEANSGDQLVAIDSLGALRADSYTLIKNGDTEPRHVPVSSEQGECTSVSVCRDMSMEAVSEPLAQEFGSMLEQNAMHDKLAAINSESQHVVSHVEAETPNMETVQNQSVECVVEDGKPVNGLDDDVLVVRNNDVKESFESESESAEVSKMLEQEAEALNKEHGQSDMTSLEVFDGSVPEPSKIELKEVDGTRDEIEEGKVADHEDKPLHEELGQDDGGCLGVFDGSVAKLGKSDVDEIFESGDRIVEGEVAVAEQETVAPGEEPEDHSLKPLAGTSFPQVESVEESKKQEFSEAVTHVPSPPSFEINVSSGTNPIEKVRVVDGPKDGEKSAPVEKQSPAALEQSIGVRRVSGIAPPKKQSEKVITGDKVPKAELSKVLLGTLKETKEGDHAGDYIHAKSRSGQAEESFVKTVQKPSKQGSVFGIGDLVWAKVRSHPWWPAQIFDPADASKSARKAKKSGRVLVAFFGDCTFAWVQQSQMIAFRTNFKEKVQQTTMRIFCLAVEEALEELCRRSELGLSCRHFKGSLHSTSSFPDANTGIREGVRVERSKDIRASAEMFRPKKTLEFVKNVAAAPLGAWSSTLQWAESRGHAYGLRTCMVAMQGSDLAPMLLTPRAESSKVLKLKRSHSSLNAEDIPDAGHRGKESQKTKKLKPDKDRKDSEGKGSIVKAVSGEGNKQGSSDNVAWVKSGTKDLTDTRESKKERNIIKIKLSKKMKSEHFSSCEKRLDSTSVEVGDEKNSDDSKETLLAIAGHSVKVLKRSSSKEDKTFSTSKKARRQTGEELQNDTSMHQAGKVSWGEGFSDLDADASLRTEADTEDAFNFLPSPSKGRVKKAEGLKMSAEVGSKNVATAKDTSAGKNKSSRKFSKVGDSIRRVASELKGTPVVKVVDDVRHTGPEAKKDLEDLPEECQASPMGNQVSSKESSEDVSLLQLRRDLELLTKKAGSGGAKGKTVKLSKKRDQAEAVAAKSSPQWQSVPQRSQRSCVQELALAARKRKSEIVHDEILSKLPKNSSTSGSQRRHPSKGYITSAEKPGEREHRTNDKSLLLYSRRPAPHASTMKTSSQRYDEKLSSHTPLGLFMRFPEDFPLPSEAQLKAIFIPFGPLQMSATRLYKDSASAQVVFKHGRDAESALKHAKKNPMFGQVAVTYRLRHLSHSTRIEMKSDHPISNKTHASQVATLRALASSRDKLGGTSVSSEKKRTVDKEVVSSSMPSSSNHDSRSGSDPTGDIQDQMMTLLRQVSVIVNTSPVTSDGS